MCGIPVEMLTAVPALAGALALLVPGGAVVVAPDLGAVKLAEHYASLLHRPVAVVRKTRMTADAIWTFLSTPERSRGREPTFGPHSRDFRP